jgi:hypothetical protein
MSRAFAKQKLAKLHARFDKGGQVKQTTDSLLRHRQTKGAEAARVGLKNAKA